MKNFLQPAKLSVFCVAVLSICTPTLVAEEVQWLRSAEQAADIATKTGKPILVYVRSASCHYCDLMQSNVWQDPTASAIVMRDFVPLKLTQEENAASVQVLQVTRFPATIIFSADRRYVDKIDGYLAPQQFLAAVNKMQFSSAAGSSPVRR